MHTLAAVKIGDSVQPGLDMEVGTQRAKAEAPARAGNREARFERDDSTGTGTRPARDS
jgi:hypothetical protein